MNKFQIGQKVFVSPEVNHIWTGEGEVVRFDEYYTIIRMTSGYRTGYEGGFKHNELVLVSRLKILSIKRSTHKTGLKVYGKVRGDSGKEYNFAYFRRPNFRGWICSCESFFFTMFAKKRNCKHLRFVRGQVGRFAATVQ